MGTALRAGDQPAEAKLAPAAVTASGASGSNAPARAADADQATAWVSGGFPTQWLQYDLGQARDLTRARLLVSQDPAGPTTHEVWGGPTPSGLALLGTFSGATQSGQWLELEAPAAGVRYVRVVTTQGPSWVAWREVEVYGRGGAAEVRWVVTDQLGTPRMVINRTGSLAGVTRHDFLPFGEEMGAGGGGRTTNQGYSQSDNVRQKLTGKERDNETWLDYFLARYYSSTQGRFTGVDMAGPDLTIPQTLNKYQYCLNNPLRFIDRQGLYEEDVHRDLTYVLALAAGFNSSSARAISNANQGVDDNPATSPMGMTPWGEDVRIRELYHFTSEERRAEMWQAFEQTGSHQRLGEFFHAQQDSFSHAGYGARFGHLSDGHGPDKTYNDPDKADRMASDTFSRMGAALTIGIKRGSETIYYDVVDWKKIAPMVQAFNRAKTPEEKRKALSEIENTVQRDRFEQEKRRLKEVQRQEERRFRLN